MNDVFETEIVVDPDVPLVRIIRDCSTPRTELFPAHTDLLMQWNRPNGTVMESGVRESCERVGAVLGGIE